jgi:RNA polymerase sigma-70 factor (ECF subfamily)
MHESSRTFGGQLDSPPLPGDEAGSFGRFYAEEYRGVLGLAFVLTGDLRLAEDLTQDAFIAAWNSWTELANPAGWVRSVVSNKARSSWRRRFASQRAFEALADRVPAVVQLPDDTLDFWEYVHALPRRQAQVVALFYLDDLPASEIAELLGCDESTVRKHLTRARRNLASRLGVEP